jgi:non-ribosomal peptide synthetase component F
MARPWRGGPGYLADLNVIDLDRLECTPPEITADLPAGGRRLLQAATGLPLDAEAGDGDLRGSHKPHRDEDARLSSPDVLAAIVEHARTGPDRAAVKDLDRDLTYGALLDEVARVAAGLRSHGVREGDRVALLLPNSVDFVVAALACLTVGAIFVPLAVSDPPVSVGRHHRELRAQGRRDLLRR